MVKRGDGHLVAKEVMTPHFISPLTQTVLALKIPVPVVKVELIPVSRQLSQEPAVVHQSVPHHMRQRGSLIGDQ